MPCVVHIPDQGSLHVAQGPPPTHSPILLITDSNIQVLTAECGMTETDACKPGQVVEPYC